MPMAGQAEVEVKVADERAVAAVPLRPPPNRHAHDTYIVQFPKNQVYRVPPRENALMVEQYRNPTAAKKQRGSYCGSRVLLTVALVIVSVVAIVGITFATLYFILNPTGPTFSVSEMAVINSNSKNSRPKYEVWLRAKNPNEKLGLGYEMGIVYMRFEETKVAAGRFPRLEQDPDESSKVKVEVTGYSRSLPKGMNGGADTPVDLKLEMKLGVRMIAAGFDTWLMRSYVVCDLKVSGIGNPMQILSQECDAKFKQY